MGNPRLNPIMEGLYDEWGSCLRCSIGNCHKAIYRGSERPKILFIAPLITHADTVSKRPMSGLAGRLIDQMAKDCSLPRESYGVTSLVSCLTVQKNDPSKDRDPAAEEIENCRERLDDVIESLTPNYYIALGALVKKHPPDGVQFALQMESPIKWSYTGGNMSLSYKRDRHKLKKFLREVEI